MKYSMLGLLTLLVSGGAWAEEIQPFTVTKTETPAMCQASGMPAPMPCAFMLAMMNKMRTCMSNGACTNTKTCALKGI